MRIRHWLISALSFLLLAGGTPAEASSDDEELRQIFEADQHDRAASSSERDWKLILPRDAARRRRVRELNELGRVRSGKDLERAASCVPDQAQQAQMLAGFAKGRALPLPARPPCEPSRR